MRFPLWTALLIGIAAVGYSPEVAYSSSANLGKRASLVISGASEVASAGDVNGDGIEDVLVGNCSANGRAGFVAVLFGPFHQSAIDVSDDGFPGFRISGTTILQEQDNGGRACYPGKAGDVNGDGLDDVLVGAPHADNNNRSDAGTAYVVFGKSDSDPVDLAEFDQNRQLDKGFRIDGGSGRSLLGRSLDGIGDVNADGFADVVVGGPFAGGAYVVFGKTDMFPVDLALFDMDMQGEAGYRIAAPQPTTNGNGYSLAGAGDVNGDEVPDVIFGFVRNGSGRGSAYVVFGQSDSAPRSIKDLGSGGFRIKGADRGTTAGFSVAAMGDMNRDGFSDVAVGAPDLGSSRKPGEAFVVFGQSSSSTVQLASLGDRGFRIVGKQSRDLLGWSMDGLQDLNGDGISDLILGAPSSRSATGKRTGAAYVVHGKRGPRTIFLERLGVDGMSFVGATEGEAAGEAVAGLGDVTEDGVGDFLIAGPILERVYLVRG